METWMIILLVIIVFGIAIGLLIPFVILPALNKTDLETSETAKTPETPETPTTPKTPATPEIAETPETPETPTSSSATQQQGETTTATPTLPGDPEASPPTTETASSTPEAVSTPSPTPTERASGTTSPQLSTNPPPTPAGSSSPSQEISPPSVPTTTPTPPSPPPVAEDIVILPNGERVTKSTLAGYLKLCEDKRFMANAHFSRNFPTYSLASTTVISEPGINYDPVRKDCNFPIMNYDPSTRQWTAKTLKLPIGFVQHSLN